jgi:outer membrane immunogenic protein
MRKYLVVLAALSIISASALSQTTAPSKRNATNWTGFYAGLNAGGAIGSSNAQTGVAATATGINPSAVPQIDSVGNQNLDPKGYAGGLQFGYNRQIADKWVLGAEADYGAFVTSNSVTETATATCCAPDAFTIDQKVSTDWLSTVRLRAGHTITRRGLLFVSGGAAETQFHYSSLFTTVVEEASESASSSVLKTGWIIGGGGEFALNRRWSVRAEYLYSDFGSISNAGTVTYIGVIDQYDPSALMTHTATLTSNISRLAVNYRF